MLARNTFDIVSALLADSAAISCAPVLQDAKDKADAALLLLAASEAPVRNVFALRDYLQGLLDAGALQDVGLRRRLLHMLGLQSLGEIAGRLQLRTPHGKKFTLFTGEIALPTARVPGLRSLALGKRNKPNAKRLARKDKASLSVLLKQSP